MNGDLLLIALVAGTVIISTILFAILSEIQIITHKSSRTKDNRLTCVSSKPTCPYCCIKNDTGEIINNAGDDFTIMKHDDEEHFSLVTGTRECHILTINYCPVCGRDLTVNNGSTGQ